MIIIVCGRWLMDIEEEGKNRVFFHFKTISDKDRSHVDPKAKCSTSENVQKTMSKPVCIFFSSRWQTMDRPKYE